MPTCSATADDTTSCVSDEVALVSDTVNCVIGGVSIFESGDTLSFPRLDSRPRPVGFKDARDRPAKRSAEEVAQQKAEAQKRRLEAKKLRDKRTEKRVQYADEFHGQTDKGPASIHHRSDWRAFAANACGMAYRPIKAPRGSHQVQSLVDNAKRETPETRSRTVFIPMSFDYVARGAS